MVPCVTPFSGQAHAGTCGHDRPTADRRQPAAPSPTGPRIGCATPKWLVRALPAKSEAGPVNATSARELRTSVKVLATKLRWLGRAGCAQDRRQPGDGELVQARRGGEYDEHPLIELVPEFVVGHVLHVRDGQHPVLAGPYVRSAYDTHRASRWSRAPPCQAVPTVQPGTRTRLLTTAAAAGAPPPGPA